MAPTFPNPPLQEIDPALLSTRPEAAAHCQVSESAIKQWVHAGKIEAVDLGPGGPQLYYLPVVAQAEYDAWENGASRPFRGGRKPGWKPCINRAA